MSGTEFDYGVCRLSLVALRAEPAHAAEQTSQLLFGEHYKVIDTNPGRTWLLISNYSDQFAGWLDARQHHPIPKEHFDYINEANFKITTDITSSILYNKAPLQILMGSIIPISGAELFKMEEQFAFNGESKNLGQKRDVEFLKATAARLMNTPFLHGGRSPFGIDPPAFTQLVFKLGGYFIGRTIQQQMEDGRPVNELDDVVPGDLVFFKGRKDKAMHVGLLLADDKVIHVGDRVRVDHFDEEGILNPETRVYTHTVMHACRILPAD